jgi:hypothetical protein
VSSPQTQFIKGSASIEQTGKTFANGEPAELSLPLVTCRAATIAEFVLTLKKVDGEFS